MISHGSDGLRVSGPTLPLRGWLGWSGALVAAYLLISSLGWKRTLIDTEVWALYYAGKPFTEQMQAIRGDLVHPPLMYLVQRLWLSIFGQTDNAAKALALVINLPTFFFFTWLAHRVTSHWRLASLFFLSLYLQVGSTPNQVRMYGLGLLLTVAAMILWEEWRESLRTRTLVAWMLVAGLLNYTHLFGALLLTAFFATNWLCGSRRWAFTAAVAAPALSFLPWFFYVLPVYESRGLADNLTWVPKQLHIGAAILSYGLLGEFAITSIKPRIILAIGAALINLTIFLLAWRVARRLWPPGKDLRPAALWFWVALLLAGIPLLLDFVFSIAVASAVHWRFVLGVLPAYWLLVVLVCEEGGRAGHALLYGAVLPWVLASTVVSFVTRDTLSPARQAAHLLAAEQRPADLILCENLSLGNELYWEWTHRLGRSGRMEVLRPPAAVARLSVLPATNLESVDLASASRRVWFFYANSASTGPVKESLARRGFALERELPTGHPFLLLFARKGIP